MSKSIIIKAPGGHRTELTDKQVEGVIASGLMLEHRQSLILELCKNKMDLKIVREIVAVIFNCKPEQADAKLKEHDETGR